MQICSVLVLPVSRNAQLFDTGILVSSSKCLATHQLFAGAIVRTPDALFPADHHRTPEPLVSKKGWAMKVKIRCGLLLTAACMGSVLIYFITFWGDRVTATSLYGIPESAGTITFFLTLQLIGTILASFALDLGDRDGKLGWADLHAVIAAVTFFSLIGYLYAYRYLPLMLWRIGIPPNFFIAPDQPSTTFVVGRKLFWENLALFVFILFCSKFHLSRSSSQLSH